ALLLERAARPFTSPEDLYRRARVSRDVLWALAESGALATFGPRRDVLWQLGVLERKLGTPGLDAPPLLDASSLNPLDLAELPTLTPVEETEWDLRRVGATSGPHPIAQLRPELQAAGVQPIERATPGRPAAIAGLVIARQRPPTAKGIVFITLEDETGRMQCITHPQVWEAQAQALRAGALILRGEIKREGAWRGLIVHAGWPLTARGGQDGDPHA
ncbi:MAG TPA: OB-fold nucleic acid binding domain-containing protein, partial [Deinococcales bacterium]|nr:OB-fold nucleic acid binding domain-containing protein [Deinococcales bacterium]